jgi:hypothetical protein
LRIATTAALTRKMIPNTFKVLDDKI